MKQKIFIRLIKEHKVDHQFFQDQSEIEMDITDEVRRQTGIVLFRRIRSENSDRK